MKYDSMAHAKREIRKIISSATINQPFHNDELARLLTFHPKEIYSNKNDIEYFCIRYDRAWRSSEALYVKKRNHSERIVSWNKCIRHRFGKYKVNEDHQSKLIAAFREEIQRGSRRDYFLNVGAEKIGNSWYAVCEKCGLKKKAQSDHYLVPFKKIMTDFLQQDNMEVDKVELFHDIGDFNKIKLKDRKLAKRWLTYHDSVAKWRILCGQCNVAEGTYGY